MTNNEALANITSILSSFGATDIVRPTTRHAVILSFTMADDDVLTLMHAAVNGDLDFALIFAGANAELNRYSIDITAAV